MSNLLYRWGRTIGRHPVRVLVAWLVLIVLGGIGAATLGEGTKDDFSVPGTESQTALDTVRERFPELAGASAQILVQAPEGTKVTEEPASSGITSLVGELEGVDQVKAVVNPLTTDGTPLVSEDGSSAIVQVQLAVPLDEVTSSTLDALSTAGADLRDAGATVSAGGDAFNGNTPALSWIEALGIVMALVVLYLMLRSFLASVMPIVSALLGVAVTLTLTMAATAFVSVSPTAPMLSLMIGLAVGIDYALLVIAQYRENLSHGMELREAVARSLATSGSAVIFAGSTVAIALVALAVAGIPFLSIMGFAAAGGVVFAVAAALTVVPAIAALAGTRLTPKPRRDGRHHTHGSPFLRRWVGVATRWPKTVTVAVVVVLLGLALPAASLRLALPSGAWSEEDAPQRITYDAISDEFGPGYNSPLLVTADILMSTDPVNDVKDIAERIRAVDGVVAVNLATPNRTGDMGAFAVISEGGPDSETTQALVERLRDQADTIAGDPDVSVKVTGQTAIQIDISQRLADALLPYGVIVVALSFALLAVAFRSLLMPLAAALGYALSVFAAFGLTSAVFVHGWGADLLHVQHVGPLIAFLPIIVMGVLFGLAMDYQVFLVSRIWELKAHGDLDPTTAVREGFVRSAPVVITAALIMLGVFVAFVPEGDAILQPIAFALAVGVAIDAFVVRLLLIPAVLRLVGDGAWWFPKRWDEALPHVDIEGAGLSAATDPPAGIGLIGATLPGSSGYVLDHTDFVVAPGQIGVIVGEPGAGKSLTLLALAGRAALTDGAVFAAGHTGTAGSLPLQRSVALTEIASINELDGGLTVGQHVAEAFSARQLRPWISGRRVEAEVEGFNQWIASVLDDPSVGRLEAAVPVEQLTPLQRRLLSIMLALLSRPDAMVFDDVDALRTEAEQVALWRVALALARPDGTGEPVSVVVTAREVPGFAAELDLSVLQLSSAHAKK